MPYSKAGDRTKIWLAEFAREHSMPVTAPIRAINMDADPIEGRRLLAGRVLQLLAALLAAFLPFEAASAADACWAPQELRSKPGEERVIQGTEKALVPPPAVYPGPISKGQFPWRGVLRRVDLPPGLKLVALTFDLCEQPHEIAGYQGELVDYLRDNGIKATFFAGGKWLLTHPQRAQQLMADPAFEVANHTWEHRNLRLLSGSALADEILRPQSAYIEMRTALSKKQCLDRTGENLAGERIPAHMSLFRFPFGACNKESLEAVEAAGLHAIQWDLSSSDPWAGETPDKMLRDVVSHVHPGSIVLFHANGRGWHTSKAIPAIVTQLRAQGYDFVTVSELLKIPGAKPVTSGICYDSRPGDTDKYDELARKLADKHARVIAGLRAKTESASPQGE